MPTGYTAAVLEGATFEQFVWRCARNFGALILMRDGPFNAPIPMKFEPSKYSKESLEKARSAMDRLRSLTPEETERLCLEAYDASVRSADECNQRIDAENSKFEAMMQKVEAWTPPTDDHVHMKKFMIDQLKISLTTWRMDAPKIHTPSEWLALEIESTQRQLSYAETAWREEVERTDSRNKWLAELRKSVPMPDSAEIGK